MGRADALESADPGFVLVDVRSSSPYSKGHIPGAISLAHGKIIASKIAAWRPETLFVTYCADPHCKGAARSALRLAKQGPSVKIMVGGATGWTDEGFALQVGNA